MDITVRDDNLETVCIIFGENGEAVQRYNQELTEILDVEDGTHLRIYTRDINYLIKALQKAKELWGDGENDHETKISQT